MNLPPDEYILVGEERELEFLNACFAAAGIDAAHGELVSRLRGPVVLIYASRSGISELSICAIMSLRIRRRFFSRRKRS